MQRRLINWRNALKNQRIGGDLVFAIENKTIKITRGDSAVFTLDVKQNGEEYDYTNDEVKFTVKKNTNTDEILIQKTAHYGEDVMLEPEDTENLPYGDYVYDVQLKTDGGFVDTIITPSKFTVLPEVTF